MIAQRQCVTACEQLVRDKMGKFDCSHDVSHVWRVRSLALRLGKTMEDTDLLVVEISALLHDLYDHKYDKSNLTSIDQGKSLISFLCDNGLDFETAQKAVNIVQLVGYTKELARERTGQPVPAELVKEYSCVQDADYLDAIGAIGVLRTSAYTGASGNSLYVKNPESSADESTKRAFYKSCAQHFQDKLLLIRDRMRTNEGRYLAESRHAYMQDFLQQWKQEIDDSS